MNKWIGLDRTCRGWLLTVERVDWSEMTGSRVVHGRPRKAKGCELRIELDVYLQAKG